MRRWSTWGAGAAALLLANPVVAEAGEKGDAAGALLFVPLLTALVLLPTGWAFQALILAYAPRRGLALVQAATRHRWKTLILGAVNTGFLGLAAIALGRPAPPLALLAVLVWLVLALVGAHGLARGLGARALGREAPSGPPRDLAEASLGWTILAFGAAIPLLGGFLALYWGCRATGSAILALLAVEAGADEAPEAPAE